MALNKQHEMHTRRFSRNLGLGLVLGSVIAIIFGLTIVKVGQGEYGQTITTNSAPIATEASE